MADDDEQELEDPKKKSKLPLVIGLVVALLGGGGGFYAVYSGMLFGSAEAMPADDAKKVEAVPLPDIAFVEIDPFTVSIGPAANRQHLRFRTHLEVATQYKSDVEALMPRVVDVLNTYLRALDVEDLEDPAALVRLRAQMLRRVQIVTGEGRVNDLLIMEFVLN